MGDEPPRSHSISPMGWGGLQLPTTYRGGYLFTHDAQHVDQQQHAWNASHNNSYVKSIHN
jgi:hypothetical protein